MNVRTGWQRRLDPDARYGLRLTLFALAFLLTAVPFGWLLNQVARSGPLVKQDTAAARRLHEWVVGSPTTVGRLEILTFLGAPVWFYLLLTPIVVVLWRRGRGRLALFLAATTLLGGLLDTVVKIAVNRPRPVLPDAVATAQGRSFPSGHAMTSTIAYGALLLVFLPIIPRRWRAAAVAATLALVASICFSRLALGVHFLSDVLGGFVLGLAWLIASAAAFSLWRVDRGQPPVEPLEGLEPEAAADLSAPAESRSVGGTAGRE